MISLSFVFVVLFCFVLYVNHSYVTVTHVRFYITVIFKPGENPAWSGFVILAT